MWRNAPGSFILLNHGRRSSGNSTKIFIFYQIGGKPAAARRTPLLKKEQLVQQYDALSMQVAVKQMDYEEVDERLKEANERADRIEVYIKTQSDTLVDLEEKATKLERKAEIAEMVYEMARGSGGNETLRDKLIDVMYENEQLKTENSKLRETLNKAYDFMKQFVVDGRNLMERFLESIGQVVDKVRDGFRR